MTRERLYFEPSISTGGRLLILVIALWFLAGLAAAGSQQQQIPVKITPADSNASALANQTFWVKASSSIEVFYRGGKVTVPISKIKEISFVWNDDSGTAELMVLEGDPIEVKARNPKAELSAVVRGLPLEVNATFPFKSIASWKAVEVSSPSSSFPAAGTKLFVKAVKDANELPLVLVGEVDKDDKFVDHGNRYQFQQLTTTVGGISLRCPLGALKAAKTEGKELQLTLYDGSTIRGEGPASKIKGRFRGMDIEVENWREAEFFWQSEDAPAPETPQDEPRTGSLLVAVFTKGGIRSPEFVLAEVQKDGKCRAKGSSSEPTFEIATDLGNISCPLSKVKSISVTDEQAVVVQRDGTTFRGKAKPVKMVGLVGQQDASIEGWSEAELSWRLPPVKSLTPTDPASSVLAVHWSKRYYRIRGLPGRSFIIKQWLDSDARKSTLPSLYADYKGAKLDVSKGCRSYSLGADGTAVLWDGETVSVETSLKDYICLFTEYATSIPARVVISAGDAGEMISGDNAEKATLEKDWSDLTDTSSEVTWSITDRKARRHIVTNLRGYQPGQGYNAPPSGYYYIGGWYTEDALLGGSCVVIDMGKASAHIPLAAVEAVDTVKGLVKLTGRTGGPGDKLRGFCSASTGRDEINNYLRVKPQEWQRTVLVGNSAFGVLAIPISRCVAIERRTGPRDFVVLARDRTARTVRIETSEGALRLESCLIHHTDLDRLFPNQNGGNMDAAPYLLALGKDEKSDDPGEYKIGEIAVEIPDGPTMTISLGAIASGRRVGDSMELTLTDGRKIQGNAPRGSFLGEGVLGETSVELSETEGFTVQR